MRRHIFTCFTAMKRVIGNFVEILQCILVFVTFSSLLYLILLVRMQPLVDVVRPSAIWSATNLSVLQKDHDIIADILLDETLKNASSGRLKENTERVGGIDNLSYFVPQSLKKIDWHNYEQIKYEKSRKGLGEQGDPATNSPLEYQRELGLMAKENFNVLLSDRIALNRSLPDLRHPGCGKKLYIESLPTTSVVIPFYNEILSTLLRTVHSILNRSPPQLIKEIIMVDDGNPDEHLLKQLADYVKEHLPKVKILRLSKRAGLMGARNAGAKAATGDVLVVVDSHVEVNVNWLPPLLEPIALDHRTVVLPIVDIIEPTNFKYRSRFPARAIFTWDFNYWRLPLLPKDLIRLPEPYESPMMEGGFFTISRSFFWELGGYDPGLKEWGGEQFELSFKIWQCGGRMLEAPCSHVGNLHKCHGHSPTHHNRNLRRVADVWMDEYAEFIYKRLQGLRVTDPGDLTAQRALRQRLGCKPFRWFMKRVVFDMTQKFPTIEPKPYAEGRIRPKINPKLCLDSSSSKFKLKLKNCFDNFTDWNIRKKGFQRFVFTWHKDLRLAVRKLLCCDVLDIRGAVNVVNIASCHEEGHNQLWRYHPEEMVITVGPKELYCLAWNSTKRSVFVDQCKGTESQQWLVDVVNYDRMANWDQIVVPITGPVEEYS